MAYMLTFFCRDHKRYFTLQGEVENADESDARVKYR
jgi:hypothetical protein